MKKATRIGGTPLAVQVLDLNPFVVGQWSGSGGEGARQIALQAAAQLLSQPSERVVLDFSRLRDVEDSVRSVLARLIAESQRLGRNVCLVRCPDELFRRLQRAGLSGAVTHAGSLLAATEGLAEGPTSTLELHLRSAPELLPRLRSVVAEMAREVGIPERAEIQLKLAITEAATNAIVHGSPEGPRNHVHVSFHLDPEVLIVDVADQGPGFDPHVVPPPALVELPEHGYGLSMMRQSVDRVEFFRDDRGMLVRMTKYLEGAVEANPRAGWAT